MPRHVKTCLRAYADSEGPDQTAHPRSLIRTFTVRLYNRWVLYNIARYSKIPDQTVYLHWLIWILTVCIYHEDTFPHVAAHIIMSELNNETAHDKIYKMTRATSDDSDQPGNPPSMIRVFAVRMTKAWVPTNELTAKTDLSLRWAHMQFCWFCHALT